MNRPLKVVIICMFIVGGLVRSSAGSDDVKAVLEMKVMELKREEGKKIGVPFGRNDKEMGNQANWEGAFKSSAAQKRMAESLSSAGAVEGDKYWDSYTKMFSVGFNEGYQQGYNSVGAGPFDGLNIDGDLSKIKNVKFKTKIDRFDDIRGNTHEDLKVIFKAEPGRQDIYNVLVHEIRKYAGKNKGAQISAYAYLKKGSSEHQIKDADESYITADLDRDKNLIRKNNQVIATL